MMKMSGRVTSCCVALLLVLTSVSAVQRLNSINDLKRIDFGPSVPKHTLVLLHWFANAVEIDNTGNIRLNFDPDNRDYGAHHYGNYEDLLDPLPWGYQYYTVGNLYQETSMQLPSYVEDPPVSEYEGENRDRIIIRVREQSTGRGTRQRIDQVYITQHYDTSVHQTTNYDPYHTYEVTTNLLRQIREFSVGENQQQLQRLRSRYGSNADIFDIMQTWGYFAGLGLLLSIVIKDNQLRYKQQSRQSHWGETSSHYTSRSPNNCECCLWCLGCCFLLFGICFCFVLLLVIGLHYDKMR